MYFKSCDTAASKSSLQVLRQGQEIPQAEKIRMYESNTER